MTVTYTLLRARKIASDQYAIWIEDEQGRFVRTLYATGLVGRRAGWKIRPANTVLWTGTIQVGGAREASAASAVWPPPEAEKLGTLISAISAVYEPGN